MAAKSKGASAPTPSQTAGSDRQKALDTVLSQIDKNYGCLLYTSPSPRD